jgi:hypothetical protein
LVLRLQRLQVPPSCAPASLQTPSPVDRDGSRSAWREPFGGVGFRSKNSRGVMPKENHMAKLEIVGKHPIAGLEPKAEPGPFEVSGDMYRDAETALRSLAFLVDFLRMIEGAELRRCADEILRRP